MPVNKRYPLNILLETCRAYTEKTGRRITFEYTLVSGINDSDSDAERLCKILRGMLCHVNLIPLNKVAESGFDTVSRGRAGNFRKSWSSAAFRRRCAVNWERISMRPAVSCACQRNCNLQVTK